MIGTNALTGKPISGIEHLRQSVSDILRTPIGTRIMRRDYGSSLFELVDHPINNKTLLEIKAATAQALLKWEPRLQIKSVQVVGSSEGTITLDITAKYLPDGRDIIIDGIEVQ